MASDVGGDTTPWEDFCGGPLWNETLTWQSEDPDFTSCFEKTVLVWVPCGFLWVFLPLECFYIHIALNRLVPWTWVNVTKIFSSAVLLVLLLCDLGFTIGSEDVHPVDYVKPSVLFVTLVLQLVLVLVEKKRGMQSSGYLWIFWFLMLISSVPEYRSHFRKFSGEATTSFILNMIYFPFVVLIFVSNCFGDGRPQYLVQERGPRSSPQIEASFLNRLVFGWLERLIWQGYRKALTQEDLFDLAYENTAATVHKTWDNNWQNTINTAVKKGVVKSKATFADGKVQIEFSNEKGKKQVSIFGTLVATFGAPFLFGGILQLIYAVMAFVNPWILDLLIQYTNNKGGDLEEPFWHGMLYACLILVNSEAMSFIQSQYYEKMYTVTVRIRTAVVTAIYRKALKISNSSRKGSTVGEIVNLMAVDSQRLMDLTMYINMLWSAPVQISLAIYFLYQILGPSVFAGLAVMILLVPINGIVATQQRKLQITQMKNKDKRVKLMNELLNGMKVLKLYGWEKSFEDEVNAIRAKEIAVMKTSAYLSAVISFIFTCTPFLVTLAMFTTFALSDPQNNILTAENIFVSISYLNILNIPMAMVPMLIVATVQAGVSMGRINNFMNAEELDPQSVTKDKKEDPIAVEDGEFWWGHGEEDKAILKNVSIQVKPGALVAVVGSVGSGKSSLCSAILGEMEKTKGTINVNGSVAYVAQQAWIQNATVEKNILFNKKNDPERYKSVIMECALQADLDMLPGGDQTEIGEKGINLSGGQKQRVSLARAVYNDADIYLLDDPLSAVDSHVGKHIFEKVIGPTGCLNKKTRILVTHALTYLPEVDHIVVLKDGMITEQGSYQELLNKKGEFQDFLLQYLAEAGDDLEDLEKIKSEIEDKLGKVAFERSVSRIKRDSESSGGGDNKLRASTRSNGSVRRRGSAKPQEVKKEDSKVGQKLIETEKAETGRVSASVYSYYFKSIGGMAAFLYLLFTSVGQAVQVFSGYVLSSWADSNGNGTVPQPADERDTYLGVYGGLGVGQAVMVLVSSMIMAQGTISASKITHSRLLANMMRNPMSFFDMTPIGRIVNRFSKDLDSIDVMLPMSIRNFMQFAIMVLGTLVVIGVATPYALIIILPALVIYYFVQLLYVTTSRQLKRLESVSRSPIYSHFGETIQGASTIRAYGMNQSFIEESEIKCDNNQMAYFPSVLSNRWLAIRLEFVGNLITFSSAIFAVSTQISSGLLGLSVTYALSITQILTWLVRFVAELENNIVAVERVKEYSETPSEAAWDIPNAKPGEDWPDKGVVKFSNYSTRYREGLDLVVKGIDCEIQAEEKIGIVGRTGAGKSSLTVGLFRIIEAAGGSITIDGVDIAKIGLHDLRKRLTIIPQDPVLFSGTLRLNLDPANIYSDDAIWSALEHAHLKAFVSELPNKLQHEISEGGDNLSVGQRQLVCLARALLRKTRVLILDEATAAVDLETDDLIQQTIRREFAHATVITIAHRLNTIMDSTRVLVLDKGEVKEFDTPSVLLKNKSSIFYGMAKDAGLV